MSARDPRLVVDPIACEGHGLCAELFPERITVDDWGYPIVDDTPLTPSERAHAQRAIDACPAVALALRAAAPPPRASGRPGTAGRGAGFRRPAGA